jgi:hypothetical protein
VAVPVCIIGWLNATDLRHKIARNPLDFRSKGSVDPVMTAAAPPQMHGGNHDQIEHGAGPECDQREIAT